MTSKILNRGYRYLKLKPIFISDEVFDVIVVLIDKWEQTARNKFVSAERQEDDPLSRPTAERFVSHGAMCYYNCAQ